MADELKKAGALYEDRKLVVDGNLVTSRQPTDLPAFMREVMRQIRLQLALPCAIGGSSQMNQDIVMLIERAPWGKLTKEVSF